MPTAPKISELRQMSDDELIAQHGKVAASTVIGIAYYIHELAGRSQARQTEAMLKYTRVLGWLTFAVTLFTAVNVVISYLLLSR